MRDQVDKALKEGRKLDKWRLHWVSEPNLAVSRAQDLLPSLILVDDRLDNVDPVFIIKKLVAAISNAAILFLVDQSGTRKAGQAVLVGARSFVTKPFQADELYDTVVQVLTQAPSTQAESTKGRVGGRVVAFCAPKGGTGRTTLAINTAVSLHRLDENAPVALIDADYAAPALDVALNLRMERDITDLLPRLSRLDEILLDSVLARHKSGIKVLMAPPPAGLSNGLSLPQVQYILMGLKRMFPWVIVDLGLPFDEAAFAFLDGADQIVITVLPEMVGLRNTRLMLDRLRDEGYPESKVMLVLNRSTMKGGVTAQDIEARLGISVEYTVPDDQPLATYSINRGIPFVMSHPRSAVARAVTRIADHLIDELAPREEPELETSEGLFQRLFL